MASEAASEIDNEDDLDKVSDFDELEESLAREDGGAPRRDPIQENPFHITDDVEITTDPIVKEFGYDDSVINTLSSKGEHFFFVQTAAEVNDGSSYFQSKGLAWQGVQIPPPRFDNAGVELDSDPEDPNTIFAELYVPHRVVELGEVLMFDYMERGAWALRELYFPGSTQMMEVSDQKRQDANEEKDLTKSNAEAENAKKAEPEKVVQVPQNAVILYSSSLEKGFEKALSGVIRKTEQEKKDDKAKQAQDLADLVYKDTDVFIPGRTKVSLSISDPILPAIDGLMKKDRRMTPKIWKELRLQNYNLSPEQINYETTKVTATPTASSENMPRTTLTAAQLQQLAGARGQVFVNQLGSGELSGGAMRQVSWRRLWWHRRPALGRTSTGL